MPKFSTLLETAPTFSADDIDEFVKFLVDRVGGGDGLEVLRRMEENRYRPSKKLMDYVASVIKNNPEYTLLDEQQVAFDAVMIAARRGMHVHDFTLPLREVFILALVADLRV